MRARLIVSILIAVLLSSSDPAGAQPPPSGPTEPLDPSKIAGAKTKIEVRPDLVLARKKVAITASPAPKPTGVPTRKTPKIGFRSTVTAYYPGDAAPSKGTIVIEGTNLATGAVNSTDNLYFGTTKLVRILASANMCVYEVPEVQNTLIADLVLDDETLGGVNSFPLARGYKVMPSTALPTEAEVSSAGNNAGILKTHGINIFSVRLRNVPGSVLIVGALPNGRSNIDIIGVTFKDVAVQGNVQPLTVYDGGRPLDAVRFFGSEFTLSFVGKATDAPDFLHLNIGSQQVSSSPTGGTSIRTTYISTRVPLPPWSATRDYVVENTSDLDSRLQWIPYEQFGITEGTSDMALVGGRNLPVGHLTISGDAAFRIASGPVGTHVNWKSAPLQLNDGWTVKELHWSIQYGHPPDQPARAYVKLFSGNSVSKPAGAFVFDRAPDVFLHGDTEPVWPAKQALMMRFFPSVIAGGRTVLDPGKDPFVWFFRPMQLELNADITVINDHDVTVRLESVTFNGPVDLPVSHAFGNLLVNSEAGISFLIGDRGSSNLNVFTPTQ